MGGRREDSARGQTRLPPVPPPGAPVGSRPPAPLPAPGVDEQRSAGGRGWLVVGLVLATGATAAVVLTDDPLYLRVALLAVCWTFVVATLLPGSRRSDQASAAAREAQLRHVYDLELQREVTARQEFEVELQSRLRREGEETMRTELAQLRAELAGLASLREDAAAVAQLRSDLAGLRAGLAGIGELRADIGRMRTELTEQLSGELLIERMVMRAQSVRGPVQPAPDPADGRSLVGGLPEEPTASRWDVDRWSETRVVPARPALDEPPRQYDGSAYDEMLFGTGASSYRPSWSGDDSTERDPQQDHEGAAGPRAAYDLSGYPTGDSAPDEPAPRSVPERPGHARLEQILAESGVAAPTGGRSRRRRYRDEDPGQDDVLSRVLGRGPS